MKELKYVKKSTEGKQVDKEKYDLRKIEGISSEARSLIRPSCGCGCAPFAKEK